MRGFLFPEPNLLLLMPQLRAGLAASSPPAENVVHTGTGFGTKASLTPLFSQLFDPASVSQGQLKHQVGYVNEFSTPEVIVDLTDGYYPGYGCLKAVSSGSGTDYFPRIFVDVSSLNGGDLQQLFHMTTFKIVRDAGSGSSSVFQMKGPRATHDNGNTYTGVPRLTSSLYLNEDVATYDRTNMGAFLGGGGEIGSDTPNSSEVIARWQANDWNTIEDWFHCGTPGNADAFQRLLLNGADPGLTSSSENISLLSSSGQLIDFLFLFPGIDEIESGSQYTLKFAEHIIDITPERIVLAHASTWADCDHRKLYLFPSSWGDTEVVAPWRLVPWASSGQTVYSYVINAAGTVSSAQAHTVP